MSRSYLGSYWSSRAQPVDECAELVVEFLGRLSILDPRLASWDGGAPLDFETALAVDRVDAVVDMLRRGQTARETDSKIMKELGYSLNLWNGAEGSKDAASLSAHLGVASRSVPNNMVLQLPDSAAAPNLYTTDAALSLITSIVNIFSPDYCVWTNNRATERQNEPDRVCADGSYYLGQLIGVPAGWAVFLADGRPPEFDFSILPRKSSVLNVGHGTLVLVGDDVAEPAIEDVLQVRRAMGYEVVRP
ncbi:Imm52 family immunity protein [Mycobacterium sp. NPDC051198]